MEQHAVAFIRHSNENDFIRELDTLLNAGWKTKYYQVLPFNNGLFWIAILELSIVRT